MDNRNSPYGSDHIIYETGFKTDIVGNRVFRGFHPPAMKRVTIQDIADQAGVSKATVSRVLNNTTPVHEAKRQAVQDAIDRMGFKPNDMARSLARGSSRTIGTLTQIIGSPFYDTIAQGVISGLHGTDYSPLFVDGQWEKSAEISGIRALLSRRVDGFVLIGGDLPDEELAELCSEIPTVIVARQLTSPQHHCIFMDNVDGGFRATNHLIDQGHERIAIIRGHQHHPDAIDRFNGYRNALQEAGLPFDEQLVIEGDFSPESGVRGIDELLARDTSFTAVFAANDITAFGARLALQRHGLRVPEDVSLVGFDDQMEAAFATPPLTTIRQPAREMGEQASRAVLTLIEGEPFQSMRVQGVLVERESVAPPCSPS